MDRENRNNKWSDAIGKEMDALNNLECFEFHPPGTMFIRGKDGNMHLYA